jgi:uncharacterized membrane protein YfcA
MTAVLFGAAVVGGALNAVAGGGSFVTLPALLYAGIAPVPANATSTLALWPAMVASIVAYRRELTMSGEWLALLAGISLAGGLVGAILLVHTSNAGFMRLLPWLMLLAAVTFTFGDRLRIAPATPESRHRFAHPLSPASLRRPEILLVILLQVAIAVYGGYFGGGQGIMMLATMSLVGMDNIHEMNGLKAALGATINGVALVAFIITGILSWRPGLVMAVGAGVGGYSAAALAQRFDSRLVRGFVIIVGWAMTIYFFVKK